MKTRLFIFLTVLVSMLSFDVLAQTEISFPQVAALSPEASSIAEYQDVPVSYYSGIPSISIPLYEIDVDGFKIPLSLNYHASGIKVSQEATWVGLGWTFDVGGRISRIIKNADDFINNNYDPEHPSILKGYYYADSIYYIFNPRHYYPNTYTFWGNNDVPDGVFASVGYIQQYDSEPDIFYYNLPSLGGKFLFDKSRNNVLFDKSHNLVFTPFVLHNEIFFSVTDSQGNKYIFKDVEKTKTYRQKGYLNKNGTTNKRNLLLFDEETDSWIQWQFGAFEEPEAVSVTPYEYVSCWCLSEIITSRNRHIRFSYQHEKQLLPVQESVEHVSPLIYSSSVTTDYFESKTENDALRLSRIDFDDGYITFTCSNRKDINSPDYSRSKKLDRVSIYNNSNRLIKNIDFEYEYFNPSYIDHQYEHVFTRLKLKKVTDSTIGNPYEFSYYENGSLPAKNSKNTDYWGYSNGGNYGANYYSGLVYGNTIYAGVIKNAVFNNTVNGSLQQITYPTGGHQNFEYELNRFNTFFYYRAANSYGTLPPASNAPAYEEGGGLRIKSITSEISTRSFSYPIGKLMTEPVMYYTQNRYYTGVSTPYLIQLSESRTSMSTFNNGYTVGYDYVTETVGDDNTHYYNKYYFVNEPENELIDDNFTDGPVIIHYDNGLLTKKERFDDDNMASVNEYTYSTRTSHPIYAIYDRSAHYLTGEYLPYSYRVEWPLLVNESQTTYTSTGSPVTVNKSYEYNSNHLQSKVIATNSQETVKEIIRYAPDKVTENYTYRLMRDSAVVGIPVEVIKEKNGNAVAASRNIYRWFERGNQFVVDRNETMASSVPVPLQNVNNAYMTSETADEYDDYGNLRQCHGRDGVYKTYLWGYNHKYLIAEIIGATYLDVSNVLGTSVVEGIQDAGDPTDENIRQTLSRLQQSYHTTIYTHKPLVGITSITAPNGNVNYYFYDNGNRLVGIKDNDHSTIMEYEYNYQQ